MIQYKHTNKHFEKINQSGVVLIPLTHYHQQNRMKIRNPFFQVKVTLTNCTIHELVE